MTRRPSLIAKSSGLIVAALAMALASCSGENPGAKIATRPPSEGATSPLASPPGDGAVTVAEEGLSLTSDGAGSRMVSYGIVLENTSRYVAYYTNVTVNVTDADGRSVISEPDDHRVHVIMPGGRTAIGDVTQIDKPGAAKINVTFSDTQWWPVDNKVKEFAGIIARDVEMERDDTRVNFRFTVESEYKETVEHPLGYVIFRNSAGKIIGGGSPRRIVPDSFQTGMAPARLDIPNTAIPKDLDEESTEIYIAVQ